MPEYEGVRGVKKDAIYRLYIIEYMCVIMLGMEASWAVFPEWLLKYFFITKYWNLFASTYRIFPLIREKKGGLHCFEKLDVFRS